MCLSRVIVCNIGVVYEAVFWGICGFFVGVCGCFWGFFGGVLWGCLWVCRGVCGVSVGVFGGCLWVSEGLSLIHISEPMRQAEIAYAVFCWKKKKLRVALCLS